MASLPRKDTDSPDSPVHAPSVQSEPKQRDMAIPMLRPGRSVRRSAHSFGRPVSTNFKAIRGQFTDGGQGEGRRRRVSDATKPATPRLAAVEAAEQALELRVGGAGILRLGWGLTDD
jgi:hypothetical protein